MTEPDGLIETLELHEALPDAPFTELHSRSVDLSIDTVWQAALDVTASEVRALAPLMALRGIPSMLRQRRPPLPIGNEPLLDLFVQEGFVLLRKDAHPVNGRAVLLFGAVGRFWSATHNQPVPFESAEDFLAFDEPDYAKTVCRVEARSEGERTRLETETVIAGTDAASNNKFRPYWMLIRGPSGLIRRSWLGAIDRKAQR